MPVKTGIQNSFKIPGFRVALAIASLPGMTLELLDGFLSHDTRLGSKLERNFISGSGSAQSQQRGGVSAEDFYLILGRELHGVDDRNLSVITHGSGIVRT
jgi:hypothetical protein